MVSWCNEWWWCIESGPLGTGIALGPGGGARPCRDGKPGFAPRSWAGLGDVWSGVPEGVLSSSELPKIVLFPLIEEVNGLWLLPLEFSLFSLRTETKVTHQFGTNAELQHICEKVHNNQGDLGELKFSYLGVKPTGTKTPANCSLTCLRLH